MRLTKLMTDTTGFEFSETEIFIIKQALNEICNGFDIDDQEFSIRIGVDRSEAEKLLSDLHRSGTTGG